MTLTYKKIGATVCGAALLMAAVTLRAQTAEVFSATASVKGAGGGSGTLAPAATIQLNGTAYVVEDYGVELVRLTGVKKTK